MKRCLIGFFSAVLLGVGAWQLGGGLLTHGKAALGQILLTRAWADAQMGMPSRPWPWADTKPIARLKAPAISMDALVLEGATGESLAWGPGHQDGTAAPGTDGLSVVAGHRDTHFAEIGKLQPGDVLQVTRSDGESLAYEVIGAQVVDKDSAWVDPNPAAPRLLLVTCFPFDAMLPGGPLRYVVVAEASKADARQLAFK